MEVIHKREVYTVMHLLGDVGGVLEITILFSAILLGYLSKFSFNLSAIQTLYLARTSDSTLFRT